MIKIKIYFFLLINFVDEFCDKDFSLRLFFLKISSSSIWSDDLVVVDVDGGGGGVVWSIGIFSVSIKSVKWVNDFGDDGIFVCFDSIISFPLIKSSEVKVLELVSSFGNGSPGSTPRQPMDQSKYFIYKLKKKPRIFYLTEW